MRLTSLISFLSPKPKRLTAQDYYNRVMRELEECGESTVYTDTDRALDLVALLQPNCEKDGYAFTYDELQGACKVDVKKAEWINFH